MTVITFRPTNLVPVSRSYSPGRYPQTVFEALNGVTEVIQFGPNRFNSKLELSFSNIPDSSAAQIMETYENTNKVWNSVSFAGTDVMDCAGSSMQAYMFEGGLLWRFAEPPQVEYTFKNLCNVTCTFIGFLDPD